MHIQTADQQSVAASSPGLPDLLVVGGVPRAGTSLLRRILVTHPQIRLMPWEHHALRFYDLSVGLHLAGVCANMMHKSHLRSREQVRLSWRYARHMISHYPLRRLTSLEMIHQTYAAAMATADTRYVGDKYPDYLLHYPRFIHRPNTRCIFIYRDPRDVIASMLIRVRRGTWKGKPWTARLNTVSKAAGYWTLAMQCIDDIRKLRSNALIVRYEDFVTDPAARVAAIADHLSVPVDGFDCGEPSPGSIGRYAQTLTAEDVATIEQSAGDMMRRYGYL